MSLLVEENGGYRYLLTVIDVFSKQAWVKKLKKGTVKASWILLMKYLSLASLSSYRWTRAKCS